MMKQLKSIICVLMALTLILSGCGAPPPSAPGAPANSGSPSTPAASPGSTATKDVVKAVLARECTAIDGFTGNNQTYSVAYMILDTLTKLNEDSSVSPRLATSWEQVDDLTWRFKLRDDVTFTNGEKFNAETAAYSVNYMAGLDTAYQNWKQWGEAWPPEATVEDEYTILIKTPAPCITMPNMMTRGAMMPLNAADDTNYFKAPVGTGPYKLVKWETGVGVELEANEDYWDGAPKVKRIVYDVIMDASARALAIQSGEYDFVSNVPFDTAVSMLNKPSDNVKLDVRQSTGTNYFYFNYLSSNKFIQMKEFRKAMTYAIDSAAISDIVLNGLTKSLNCICPDYLTGAYSGETFPARNIETAKKMAKDCGYNGEEIVLIYRSGQFNCDLEIAEILITQLMEAGFNITMKEYDTASWNNIKKSGDYDLCLNGYGGSYTGDTEQYYTQGMKNTYWILDDCEKLIEEIYAGGVSAEERAEKLSRIMEICWEQTPYLWGVEAISLWAVNPALKGYEVYPHAQFDLSKAYFE